MKKLVFAMVGACALTLGAVGMGAVEPAQARSNVGVYIGPGGVGFSVERTRRSCRDYWFRRRHPGLCARYYNYGPSYYPSNYYRYDRRHWRDRHHRRHHRYHDRW